MKLGIVPIACAILLLNKKTLKDHTELWETRYTPEPLILASVVKHHTFITDEIEMG